MGAAMNYAKILAILKSIGGLADTSNVQVLTNKAIVQRVSSQADAASITPNVDNYDEYVQTAQAQALTISNPTGTPTEGQTLMIKIKDNASPCAVSFGANYAAYGAALPTTTVTSKTLLLMCIYNSAATKWMVLPAIQEQ